MLVCHADAGKSTLAGSLLYLTGHVDKRTIEKFEREAKDRNREVCAAVLSILLLLKFECCVSM